MDRLQELKLPEEIYDESGDEDDDQIDPSYYSSDQFHSFERVFQNHFEVKDKKWILVPRDKIHLIKKAWKKIEKWAQIIKQEYTTLSQARKEYEEMSKKNQQFQEILEKVEKAAAERYDLLLQQHQKLGEQSQAEIQRLTTDFEQLKETLKEREKKIMRQERSNQMLVEEADGLHIRIRENLEKTNAIKKELYLIKQIKNLGAVDLNQEKEYINSSQKTSFSTFELLLNSKVKDKFMNYLSIHEYLTLTQTSKKLYLAFGVPKILVPFATKVIVRKVQSEIQLYKHAEQQFQNLLLNSPSDQVKNLMLKVYEHKLNITENINPILKDTQNFIDGQQFIGATSIRTDAHMYQDSIESFLSQQQMFYEQSLKTLKNSVFPWRDFFIEIIDTTPPTQQQKQQQILKFHTQSSLITQRLFEISNLCSHDSGLFSMYLSQLQKYLSQIYVFAQNLSIESQQLQTMCYYVMKQYFDITKVLKISRDQLDDAQETLGVYSNTREYLMSRVSTLEKTSHQQLEQLRDLQQILQEKDLQIMKLTDSLYESEKQVTKKDEMVKQLAVKTLQYKTKYNDCVTNYNEILEKFKSISTNVSELVSNL